MPFQSISIGSERLLFIYKKNVSHFSFVIWLKKRITLSRIWLEKRILSFVSNQNIARNEVLPSHIIIYHMQFHPPPLPILLEVPQMMLWFVEAVCTSCAPR